MAMSPLQQVKKFGGRQQLIEKIMPLLDGADDGTRSSLNGTTNKKLLRIYETAELVKTQHGGRKALIAKIVTARYPKGKADDGFLKQVEEATLKRLLEFHNQAPKG